MSKSDQAEVQRRVHDVSNLIMAGADFSNIKQYAEQKGWGVSERQLRRYVGLANEEFAEAGRVNRQESRGRHIRKCRYIYARALKAGDLRTALVALQGEARLEGLYQPLEGAVKGSGPPRQAPLACDERLWRYYNACHSGNSREMQFMQDITPKSMYQSNDLNMAALMLGILTMTQVKRQLESAAWIMYLRMMILESTEPNDGWELLWGAHCYIFKVRHAGWKLFTDNLNLKGERVLRDNYEGDFLAQFSQQICDRAPTEEELLEEFTALEIERPKLLTVEEVAEEFQADMRLFFESSLSF